MALSGVVPVGRLKERLGVAPTGSLCPRGSRSLLCPGPTTPSVSLNDVSGRTRYLRPGGDHGKKRSGRIYVKELSEALDRNKLTIRLWIKHGELPPACMPHRDENNWKYWTSDQVDLIRAWMDTRRTQSDDKLAKLRARRRPYEEIEHQEWFIYYDQGRCESGPFEDKSAACQAAAVVEGDVVVSLQKRFELISREEEAA